MTSVTGACSLASNYERLTTEAEFTDEAFSVASVLSVVKALFGTLARRLQPCG